MYTLFCLLIVLSLYFTKAMHMTQSASERFMSNFSKELESKMRLYLSSILYKVLKVIGNAFYVLNYSLV